MTTSDPCDDFGDAYRGFIDDCLRDGMSEPFVVILADEHGAFCVVRRSGKASPELIVSHLPGTGMRLPVHISVLDANGEVARLNLYAGPADQHHDALQTLGLTAGGFPVEKVSVHLLDNDAPHLTVLACRGLL